MADPREVPIDKRRRNLTPLMEAKALSKTGDKVNFCPFGCADERLDENGYCRHLVGFTSDGKTYEPMVRTKDGRRTVRVRKEPTGETVEDTYYDDDGNPVTQVVQVLEPVRDAIQKGDKLVPITVSSRVYRDVDNARAAKAS